MTSKQQLYLTLCGLLCSRIDREDWLLENDPETWKLSREIDTWLTTYMNDDRVSVEQFERNVNRLRDLYVDTAAAGRVEVGR